MDKGLEQDKERRPRVWIKARPAPLSPTLPSPSLSTEIPNATSTTHHWSPLVLWEYLGFLGNKEQRDSFRGEELSGDPRRAL